MKVRVCRVVAIATVAAVLPAAALPAFAQVPPRVGTTTSEAAGETQKAAEALAEKFSGGVSSADATPTAVPPPAPALRPEAKDAASEPAASSLIAAFSQVARPVGDHAADNATFAKQAGAEKRKARRALQARKKNFANGEPAAVLDDAGGPPPRRAVPAKDGKDKTGEPSLVAKIFNPSLWSLPKSDKDSGEKPSLPGQGPGAAYTDGQ